MTQLAVREYFTASERLRVSIDEIELHDEAMMPTYLLMKRFEERGPASVYYFVIGSDVANALESFRYYKELIQETRFIIIVRKNSPLGRHALKSLPVRSQLYFSWRSADIDITSTAVRDLAARSDRRLLRGILLGYVTPRVADYILVNKLYT